MLVNPNYLNNLAAAVDQSSNQENKLTMELSSGLSVSSLQDNPGAVASSVLLGSAMARDDSFVRSASGMQGVLQVADSALGDVALQVTSALSVALRGSNGTQSASNLMSVAQQLTGIRDQVLSLANTSFMGSYLFGGSQGSGQPFSVDNTTVPAGIVYAGDGKVQTMETPSGQKIAVNLPGAAVFGGNGAAGVLTALNQLIADFSSGTASASATIDTGALTTALAQMSTQRTVLDNSLNRLQQTATYTQTEQIMLTAQQGNLVAADLATVATQLKSAETQHQALLSVMAALGSTNLFSYMK